MALDPIRLGTPPSGQDGDDARTAFTRCNGNFASLDAWGITGGITRSVSNYNDAIAPGFHNALQGTEVNRPGNINYGLIHVAVQSDGYLRQDVVDIASGRSATRGFNAGNGQWSPWRLGVDSDQLAGINERGSNSNGRYTKFPDGSMICEGVIALPAQALGTSVSASATFASPFASGPRVVYSPLSAIGSGSQADVGLVAGNGTFVGVTPSNWSLNSYSYRSATASPVQFSYIAYGWWL